jgi:hypothetical protein
VVSNAAGGTTGVNRCKVFKDCRWRCQLCCRGEQCCERNDRCGQVQRFQNLMLTAVSNVFASDMSQEEQCVQTWSEVNQGFVLWRNDRYGQVLRVSNLYADSDVNCL